MLGNVHETSQHHASGVETDAIAVLLERQVDKSKNRKQAEVRQCINADNKE